MSGEKIIEVRQLQWRQHPTEHHAWVSIPEGFTVARVMKPVGGELVPMWEAWDARRQPATMLRDRDDNPCIYPWRDQALARAQAEYAKDEDA